IRTIAAELTVSKAVVEGALKKRPSTPVEPRRTLQAPRLAVYRQVREPGACPASSSPVLRQLYGDAVNSQLYGVADCVNVIAGWQLPLIRGALNVFDANDAVLRLQATREPFDLDTALARLHRAFQHQDAERAAVRERLRHPD